MAGSYLINNSLDNRNYQTYYIAYPYESINTANRNFASTVANIAQVFQEQGISY